MTLPTTFAEGAMNEVSLIAGAMLGNDITSRCLLTVAKHSSHTALEHATCATLHTTSTSPSFRSCEPVSPPIPQQPVNESGTPNNNARRHRPYPRPYPPRSYMSTESPDSLPPACARLQRTAGLRNRGCTPPRSGRGCEGTRARAREGGRGAHASRGRRYRRCLRPHSQAWHRGRAGSCRAAPAPWASPSPPTV